MSNVDFFLSTLIHYDDDPVCDPMEELLSVCVCVHAWCGVCSMCVVFVWVCERVHVGECGVYLCGVGVCNYSVCGCVVSLIGSAFFLCIFLVLFNFMITSEGSPAGASGSLGMGLCSLESSPPCSQTATP